MADAAFTIEEYTASDGYRWRYRRYPARGQARAELVCVHGIQSHGGWYDYSCTQWSSAGFAVSFLDRRGTGMNNKRRGDAPSFRRLLDDIAEFLRGPLLASQELPIFLVGISWGGKLAVALQRRHPGLVAGLVLLCPGFFAQVRPPLGQRLGILWSSLTNPTRRFPVPLDDPALFTADPRWQQFLRDDPLSLHQATARFLLESARLDRYLRFCRNWVRVPILLLLAERDRIIHNQPTKRLLKRFPAIDKEIIEYTGAHHTLEFEPDPDRFITNVQKWLERHVSGGRTAGEMVK